MMKPAILVALLFRALDAFRVFDCIYILTRGSNGTGSVSMLGYDNLFVGFNLGIGSAISVLIFIVAAVFTWVFVWIINLSFKPVNAINDGYLIPTEFTWSNYRQVFAMAPFISRLLAIAHTCSVTLASWEPYLKSSEGLPEV